MTGIKGRAMKPFAKQFLKSDLAVALTTVWAGIEEELGESVNELVEAVGRYDVGVPTVDPEDRSEAIRDGAAAIMAGDLEEHYLAEYTPVENAERAVEYVGMDDEEWADKNAEWVEMIREEGGEGVTSWTDDELADFHVKRQFGVDRETFEETVVGWDDETTEAAMREILLGPLDDVRDAIDAATEEIQE